MSPRLLRIIPHELCQLPADLDFEGCGCRRTFIGAVVGVVQERQHVPEIRCDERVGSHVPQIARREPRCRTELEIACKLDQRLASLLNRGEKIRPALLFRRDHRAVIGMEIAPPLGMIIHEKIEHFPEEEVIFRFRPQEQGIYIDLLAHGMLRVMGWVMLFISPQEKTPAGKTLGNMPFEKRHPD